MTNHYTHLSHYSTCVRRAFPFESKGCYNLVPRASSLKWGKSRWYSSSCLRGRNCTFWFPLEPVFFRCKDIPHKVVRKQIPIWREAKTFTLCWSWTRAILGAWNRRRSTLQKGPVTQHNWGLEVVTKVSICLIRTRSKLHVLTCIRTTIAWRCRRGPSCTTHQWIQRMLGRFFLFYAFWPSLGRQILMFSRMTTHGA